MGHVSKTTPLLGVNLSSLWQNLIWSPYVENLRALASAVPEIWMGYPKFASGSAIAEGPREALVSRNPATTKHLT